MASPKNQTPDWPVDLDMVMRKLRLRALQPGVGPMALAGALQDLGYPVQLVRRSVRSGTHMFGSDGKTRTGQVRARDLYALRLGNLLWTPDGQTSWREALTRAHEVAGEYVNVDRWWRTHFIGGEHVVTPADMEAHHKTDARKVLGMGSARRTSGKVRGEVTAFLAPLLPAAGPELGSGSAETEGGHRLAFADQLRSELHHLMDNHRAPYSANFSTEALYAQGLARILANQGLAATVTEHQDYVVHGGRAEVLSRVVLSIPGMPDLALHANGDAGPDSCLVARPKMGKGLPLDTSRPASFSLEQESPAWGEIETGLQALATLVVEQHLRSVVTPAAGARPRM